MELSHWVLALPLAALLAGLAAFAARTAIGGRAGTLRRGGRLGVRSEASSRSDAAFETANRVAAPIVAGAALIAAGCALVLVLVSLPVLTVLLVFVLAALGSAFMLVQAGKFGDAAARRVPAPARKPGGGSCSGCACGGGGCSALTRTAPESAAG